MVRIIKQNNTSLIVIVSCVAFLVGVIFAKLVFNPTIIKNAVLREGGFKYINPVLLCNTNIDQKYNENESISKALHSYSKKYPENNISVYFLSLYGGGWASLNPEQTYSPASMLKIPTVVETLKYEETHTGSLEKQTYYDGSFDNNKGEYFKPEESIQAYHYYKVKDLIPYIIKYSDNNALQVLHDNRNFSESDFTKIYSDLGIDINTDKLDFMSAKTYTLFLRVLYNSTYLTREMSEKILGLMSQSDFTEGIKAGVPKDIDVAHKFGERQVYKTNGDLMERELHDCGIIYATEKPYILCIMTKGSDFTSLSNIIKEISNTVYSIVTK